MSDTDEVAVPQNVPTDDLGSNALKYEKADVAPQQGEWFIEEIERKKKTLDAQVAKIIKAEQPITFSLLCRRMADVWQQPRVTPRFQKLIESHLGSAYLDPEDRQDAPYYWADFASSLNYTQFRTGSGRDIQDIPLVEVKNCLRTAVEQMVACPADDLKRQAARILGYTRLTPRLTAVFDRALAQLQRTGVVADEGGMLKIRE